jgi:chorismate mutase
VGARAPGGAGCRVSADFIADTRAEIDAIDLELLAGINRRIELVRWLHERKEESGVPVRDEAREEEMLRALVQANEGPLSTDGVGDLLQFVLDLTRREIHGE